MKSKINYFTEMIVGSSLAWAVLQDPVPKDKLVKLPNHFILYHLLKTHVKLKQAGCGGRFL